MLREVREETQLTVVAHEYHYSHPNVYRYGGIEADVLDVFFRGWVEDNAIPKLDRRELTHFVWAPIGEASRYDFAFDSNRIAVRRLDR